MEKRTTDKMQSVTDEEITKVLDESMGGHGFWLINHRDIIETIIANRIEIAGLSQTIQDLGYNRFRSEDNSYSDLELDMYEAIAKYNGDIDKEGRMTKKTDIYKAINRRNRDQKIKELEKSKIPGQKEMEMVEKVYAKNKEIDPELIAKTLESHFNKLKNQFNNEQEELMEQKQQHTSAEQINHSKGTDFTQYEKIIQEQQTSLTQLQAQFTELTKQNALILEKLNQTLTGNIEDKNMSKMSSSTRELAFDQIPRLIQKTKEKLSEVKIQLKNTIKFKAQKGLSVTLETLKVNEFLRSMENNLEKLSQKVQNLNIQLQILSGEKVDQKDILLLPAPLQEAAEEIVKKVILK